jgi:hypothetical protein
MFKVFFLEPNYNKFFSSSKNKFFILYKADVAEYKI